MDERFAVYVDRLKDGAQQVIDETFPASVLDLGEETFENDLVKIEGKAYLADTALVIQLHVKFAVRLNCVICNNTFPVMVELENLYLTPEPEDCRSGIFNFQEALREEMILEIPHYGECSGGSCPERQSMKPYLKGDASDDRRETQQPFKELF